MEGAAIGKVLESNTTKFSKGDVVLSNFGWRDHFVAKQTEVEKIEPIEVPLQTYLGPLGFTGDTAYIGMAGVYDYEDFWDSLEKHKIIKDEYQVIHGFDGLTYMKLLNFIWYDTGNNESYAETKKVFCNDVVANKSDEAIFIDKGINKRLSL